MEIALPDVMGVWGSIVYDVYPVFVKAGEYMYDDYPIVSPWYFIELWDLYFTFKKKKYQEKEIEVRQPGESYFFRLNNRDLFPDYIRSGRDGRTISETTNRIDLPDVPIYELIKETESSYVLGGVGGSCALTRQDIRETIFRITAGNPCISDMEKYAIKWQSAKTKERRD